MDEHTKCREIEQNYIEQIDQLKNTLDVAINDAALSERELAFAERRIQELEDELKEIKEK
jgi:hypothetical protein